MPEYALALALLVIIGVIVYNLLGDAINGSMTGTGETVKEASEGDAGKQGKGGCAKPPCGGPPCEQPPCGNGGGKK